MCQICLIFATFAQDKLRLAKLSDLPLPSLALLKAKAKFRTARQRDE